MEISGSCKKATLVGMSAGTQHTLLGLSRSTNGGNYVSQAVALAPCMIPAVDSIFESIEITTANYSILALEPFHNVVISRSSYSKIIRI